MPITTPTQFRLTPETLAQIDELADLLSIPSRAAVVRLAVARMHRRETATDTRLGGTSGRKKSRKKSA
jgi:hypothetical protein